jgi:hypothetical protein
MAAVSSTAIRILRVLTVVYFTLIFATVSAAAAARKIEVVQPRYGSRISGTVVLQLKVSPEVKWADVYIDHTYLSSGPPYSISWNSNSVSDGLHRVTVVAFVGPRGTASGLLEPVATLDVRHTMLRVHNGKAKVTPTPTPTPRATSSPTPTKSPTPTPSPDPTPTPTPRPTSTPSPTKSPTPTPSPSPSATPTPGSTALSQNLNVLFAQLLGQAVPLPTLWNSSGPQAFGAKGDGITDDTAAFQAAVNAGDVEIPPSTYLINGTVNVPSARNIQCQPGAVLYTTRHDSSQTAILSFSGSSRSAVIGCTLLGSNTTTPPDFVSGEESNFQILVTGGGNNTFVGDTFRGSWATYAMKITGGSSQNVVEYSDFESNAMYGVALVNASKNQVIFNRFVDSSLGNQLETTSQTNTGNVIAHNLVKKVAGNGYNNVFLTGGESPSGANYGGDSVLFNVMVNVDNFYTTVNSGTNAFYYGNQVNPTIPPPITVSGSNPVTKDTNALLAIVFGQSTPLPTLYKASSPQIFGAKGDGVTDDTAAFQSAINAGDLEIPSANYLINGTVRVPSYRNIQCQPGTVLHTTRHDGVDSGILGFSSTQYDTVVGCTFTGANTTTPPHLDGNQANYMMMVNAAKYLFARGNTFKYTWGNSAIHLSGSTPSSNNSVEYNDFESNGLYGTAVINGTYNRLAFNRIVDSALGAEVNSTTGYQNTGNLFTHNYVAKVNNDGYGETWLSGGVYPTAFNYSGNLVYFNFVTAATIEQNDGSSGPAQYGANHCVSGCSTH